MSGSAKASYASQWWLFTGFFGLLAGGTLASASGGLWIVAAVIVACVHAGMFIAGFCYRERLRQLGSDPRWGFFRRMLD
jgi:hypothetical protein